MSQLEERYELFQELVSKLDSHTYSSKKDEEFVNETMRWLTIEFGKLDKNEKGEK